MIGPVSAAWTYAGPTRILANGVTAPTPPTSGFFKKGDVMNFAVRFSDPVFVPNPAGVSLPFVLGTSTVNATYIGGTGTSVLTFRYTVQVNDEDRDGILLAGSVTAPTGSVKDSTGADAELTYSPPDTSSTFIDAVNPTLLSLAGPPNGTYGAGRSLTFTATFQEPMLVSGSPRIALTVGTATRYATYLAGAETRVLVFEYLVQSGDTGSNGIVAASTISLNGGSITDLAGNTGGLTFTPLSTAGVIIDAMPTTITRFVVPVSSPNGSYGANRQLPIEANTSRSVRAGSKIAITLDTGAIVELTAAATGTLLQGIYTISPGENSPDLTVTAFDDLSIADSFGNKLGNTIVPSGVNNIAGARAIVVDTSAPAAPTITSVTDDVGSIVAPLTSGGRTNDTNLAVRVALASTGALIGDRIQLFNGSAPMGSAYTITPNDIAAGAATVPTGTLINGTTYGINARLIDVAGNVSGASTPDFTITIDTTAPGAPTITSVTDDVGSIVGPLTSGGRTDDTNLAVRVALASTGALSGDRIQLFNGTATLGSAYTIAAGDIAAGFATVPTGTLINGTTYAINARLIDVAGNVGAASTPDFTITIDTTAPAVVTITSVTDDVGSIVGPLTSGGRTDDTNLAVRVALASTGALIGDRIQLFNGSATMGSAYTITPGDIAAGAATVPTGTLINGTTYAINARLIDVAGNVGAASTPDFAISIDTTAPAAPTITSVTDDVGSIVGPLTSGGRSDDTNLAVRVALASTGALSGDRIQLFNGTATLGSAYTITPGDIAAGSVIVPTGTLINGTTYAINARLVNSLGNVSAASAPDVTITIDTSAPAAPTITSVTDDVGSIVAPLTSGGRTDDTNLAVRVALASTGALIGDRIQLFNGSAPMGSAYTITPNDIAAGAATVPTGTLINGTTYGINARLIDVAGNVSGASTPDFTITIDTTAPGAPTITSVTDDVGSIVGPLTSGGRTDDTNLAVRVALASTGALSGDRIQLFNGTATLGSAYTIAAGDIAAGFATVPTGTLINGTTYAINARLIDVSGNVGAASTPDVTITIDTTAPAAPTITSVTDDVLRYVGLVLNGNATNDTTPTFAGTAEPGSSVQLRDGTTIVGTIAANAQGVWTFTGQQPFAAGDRTLVATATDSAGNASSASVPFRLTIDTVAPSSPRIVSVEDDVPAAVGALTNGGRTNDRELRISGTAEPNGRVTFWMNFGTANAVNIVTTANSQGNWTVTTRPLADGQHSFSALVRDAASNRSDLSIPFSAIVDATGPQVVAVSGPSAGTYGVGQAVDIQVRFNEAIQVGGTPTLSLNTSPARVATFIRSTGDVATFRYVPAVGDAAGRLDYTSTSALALNGGWIHDLAGNVAALSLATPGTGGSLSGAGVVAIDAAIKAIAGNLTTSVDTAPLVARSKTSIPITFNAPVTGVTLASVRLFFEGRSVSLTGATITGSGTSYTLTLPASATSLKGTYRLRLGGGSSGIAAAGGAVMSTPVNLFWKRV